LLVPASDKADRKILEGLLDSMIDMWFQKDELDPANYQMWTAKSELRSKYKELNASSPSENEAEVNQEISKDITKAFKQNLRKSNKEDELIKLFRKITGKKIPPKRVASSHLDEERERLVDRRKKWAAIVNLTSQAKSLYDAYIY
jgi:ATPase subunit of ABC transporter with duplicated ATPase domains